MNENNNKGLDKQQLNTVNLEFYLLLPEKGLLTHEKLFKAIKGSGFE